MIVLAAMTFAFTSCDILAGLPGDDMDDTENTGNEDGDGQKPGDETDEPSVPPVELLPRKVTGMRATFENRISPDENRIMMDYFTYYDDGRLKEWRSESESHYESGYSSSSVETYRYEYSDDRISAVYSEVMEFEQPEWPSEQYSSGCEIVGSMEGGRVMEMYMTYDDGETDNYTLKYDGNGFLVGYDRRALPSLEGTSSLKVEDATLSEFRCDITFFDDECESMGNAGTVIPSRYENNLNIDLYPVFVSLGETFWTNHMTVFLAPGISRYRYLPERVEYRSYSTDQDGKEWSEDRVETYEYFMSGDYIEKVIYDCGYDDRIITFEFFYE